MSNSPVAQDRYPDGELPKLIDQVIKNILTVTYSNGLYHEQKVHEILSKITPLDGFQIHAWFHKMQMQLDTDPPRRQEFMCITHQKELGQWTDEKRSILEKCFKQDICSPENFAFIGLLTGLSKNQISNWTRQKRYLLRKKGLLPPVDKSKGNYTRKRKRKGVHISAPLKRPSQAYASHRSLHHQQQLFAPLFRSHMMPQVNRKSRFAGEDKVASVRARSMLDIPHVLEIPPEQFFYGPAIGCGNNSSVNNNNSSVNNNNSSVNNNNSNVTPTIDDIGTDILNRAHEGGLLHDQESVKVVALLCGLEPQMIFDWAKEV